MSRYSAEEYTRAMMNLLPAGLAWNRHPGSIQYLVLGGLAQNFQQSDADACALIKGAFPETADAFIEEWYNSLGLNDDGGTPASMADKAQARKFILSKLLSTGGQSRDYFTALAATMGYDIHIQEYRVPLCGFSFCGVTLNTRENSFVWKVMVQPAGDEVTTSREYLEYLLRHYAPAHTTVIFEYLSAYPVSLSLEWKDGPHSLSGVLSGGDGVVVSGVEVTVTIKAMSGQHYVKKVVTDSSGVFTPELNDGDITQGDHSVYASARVDMPDDVTVSVRSELVLMNY